MHNVHILIVLLIELSYILILYFLNVFLNGIHFKMSVFIFVLIYLGIIFPLQIKLNWTLFITLNISSSLYK